MKTGLVLEGGAMRGMFTAGVLDVLMEHSLTTDGTIGVSAGAVFGCNFKSHQIGRVIRYNTEYCNDKRYASFRNLLRTGNLYSEDFCYPCGACRQFLYEFSPDMEVICLNRAREAKRMTLRELMPCGFDSTFL